MSTGCDESRIEFHGYGPITYEIRTDIAMNSPVHQHHIVTLYCHAEKRKGVALRSCKVTQRKSCLPKDPNFGGFRRLRFSAVPEVERVRRNLSHHCSRSKSHLSLFLIDSRRKREEMLTSDERKLFLGLKLRLYASSA